MSQKYYWLTQTIKMKINYLDYMIIKIYKKLLDLFFYHMKSLLHQRRAIKEHVKVSHQLLFG
jgi:hypothetical protein